VAGGVVLNPLALQAIYGLVLATFVAWQLSTGLRWIKLGRNHYRIHRATGITLAILVVPHLMFGLWLAFGLFAPIFSPLFGG
jgi:hypothetical protein